MVGREGVTGDNPSDPREMIGFGQGSDEASPLRYRNPFHTSVGNQRDSARRFVTPAADVFYAGNPSRIQGRWWVTQQSEIPLDNGQGEPCGPVRPEGMRFHARSGRSVRSPSRFTTGRDLPVILLTPSPSACIGSNLRWL